MNTAIKIIAACLGILFLLNLFGPRERVVWDIWFTDNEIGEDPEAYLAGLESQFDDILPGAEKEIIWSGAPGAPTPISIVYIHGFSATKQEMRPVPDTIAAALGANLFYTRLTGHGRGSAAMTQATANDWLNDVAEAVAIGRRIGERVILMGTSQGGTMTAMSAVNPEVMRDVAGIIFFSPNFGIANKAAGLLTMPFARTIVPIIGGKERSWEPVNPEHGKWWTTRYDTVAALPMAAAVQAANGLPYEAVTIPALFVYDPADQVVEGEAIARVAAQWGGAKDIKQVSVGPEDDPFAHVIAGDILSPSMNDEITGIALNWIGGL